MLHFASLILLLGLGAEPAPLKMSVDFGRELRPWDGFGVTYVEAAQTRDYRAQPQDYGGLSQLSEAQRQEVMELIFGSGGLEPGIVKMMLDPFHEPRPPGDPAQGGGPPQPALFDHKTSTRWTRYFAREGLARTKARGDELTVLTTLYGPPAWATKQRFVRGRDLAPERAIDLARYMISWAKYLRTEEKLPLGYLALHDEGENKAGWPDDGSTDGRPADDYNLYWPPAQVVQFLKLMRPMLDADGLAGVGLTPGETTNWFRFDEWGYAKAIADDPDALRCLGLITSEGFTGPRGQSFGDYRNTGNALLRSRRPELHAWTTSLSWGQMDVDFLENIRRQIYEVQVNAVIPAACIQSDDWIGGSPYSGSAVFVRGKERFDVRAGYHFYKQVSVAGRPGTAVADVGPSQADVGLIAFAHGKSGGRDNLVVINCADAPRKLQIQVRGTASKSFRAYRTSPTEHYVSLGELPVVDGAIPYLAPPRSATTLFGLRP